jgi:hypothetical protein
MPTSPEEQRFARRSTTVFHPLSADDRTGDGSDARHWPKAFIASTIPNSSCSQNGTLARQWKLWTIRRGL